MSVKEKVLVLLDMTSNIERLSGHGLALAKAFKKELCFFLDEGKGKTTADLAQMHDRLEKLSSDIQKTEEINIHIEKRQKLKFSHLPGIAEEVGAILIISDWSSYVDKAFLFNQRKLNVLRKSRIPFLSIHDEYRESNYSDIILPLDDTPQCKEKIQWASFFSRLNKSKIHILVPDDKDDESKARIKANMDFTRKIFKDFSVDFLERTIEKCPSYDIDQKAEEYAALNGMHTIIVLTTAYLNPFDFLFGPAEYSRICNKKKLPVLCLNPREDLYMLCV